MSKDWEFVGWINDKPGTLVYLYKGKKIEVTWVGYLNFSLDNIDDMDVDLIIDARKKLVARL